jgi:hypothetical protein
MVKLYYFRKKIGFNPIYLDYFFLDSTGGLGYFLGYLGIFLGFFWVILRFFGIKSDFWYYTIDFFSSVSPLGLKRGGRHWGLRDKKIGLFGKKLDYLGKNRIIWEISDFLGKKPIFCEIIRFFGK